MPNVTEDTQRQQWAIVLNPDRDNPSGFNIKEYFETLSGCYMYVAMIKHDEDIISDKDYRENKESYDMQGLKSGDIKPVHIHACIQTEKRIRKGKITDDIASMLNLPRKCVSVRTIEKSWRGANRYLLHLDNEDKSNYMPFDVYTTHKEYFQSFMIDRLEFISEEELIRICNDLKRPSKILIKIGIDNYRKYKGIISDLIKEYL